MKLREVQALKFRGPIGWYPKEDPRPDWRIQEIQNQIKNQNQMLGEAESQTKHVSEEIKGLVGAKDTRQQITQWRVAQESAVTSNKPGKKQKFKAETNKESVLKTPCEGQNQRPTGLAPDTVKRAGPGQKDNEATKRRP
jgi:hypothetical protein